MNDKDKIVQKYIKGMEKHARKKKLQDARRKTGVQTNTNKPRHKKVSSNDWADWDDLDEMEFNAFQPIVSKGEQERHRERELALRGSENGNSRGAADRQSTGTAPKSGSVISALVIEAGSGMCRVDQDGEIILCDLRGNLKDALTGYVNPVAVGDEVIISRTGSDRGIVETVLPRRSVLARPYSPDQGKVLEDLEQIVVANVDRLLIVASWREPYLWPALIDRYLITAQRNQIETVICINKIDLIEDQAEFESTVAPYQALGHRMILTSTVSGAGIAELRNLVGAGISVLAGLSGVGKSSLLTAVQPDLDLRVGQVSQQGLFTGQGRHTTTQSSLWKLAGGGVVIDTPGVRTFGIAGIAPSQLANWYPEMVDLIGKCRFADCMHLNEPECAIQAAVAEGSISEIRYKNYLQIVEELNRS